MQYNVKLTPHAIVQIQETIAYISKVLLVPEMATAWADHLQKEISGLDTMPARYPLTEEEPWRTRGVRRMPAMNFIVYYLIDEDNHTVWITAVVYGRRDQLNALKEIPYK